MQTEKRKAKTNQLNKSSSQSKNRNASKEKTANTIGYDQIHKAKIMEAKMKFKPSTTQSISKTIKNSELEAEQYLTQNGHKLKIKPSHKAEVQDN
jgi:hypothetical protein